MSERRTFPSIPAGTWWDLRRRFQQAVPRQVDADYLQSVLEIGPGHANNLISPLRAVGLIDADGRPTDLAHAWRSDEEYAEAAHQMLEAIYPPQLRDALPPPSPDKDAVERWFMRNTGVGEGAARKMGTLYRLICEADPTAQDRAPTAEERPARRAARAGGEDGQAPGRRAQPRPRIQAQTRREPTGQSPTSELPAPGLHIDVQVHIPADASADQIDRIFESMARHLYGRRS